MITHKLKEITSCADYCTIIRQGKYIDTVKVSDVNENDKSNVDNTEQDNNINISKDNTNLSVLRLNYEGISPDFSKDIKEYYIVVDEKVKKFSGISGSFRHTLKRKFT